MSTLSLHVLDSARGRPGVGVAFTLVRIDEGEVRSRLAEGETDAAGRWAADTLGLAPGIHEIVFAAGAYQSRFGAAGFYDVIAVRFHIERGGGHTHIPLILSPFGYSTYRGG